MLTEPLCSHVVDQALHDIKTDKYPLDEESTRLIGALLCQIDIGDYNALQVIIVSLYALLNSFEGWGMLYRVSRKVLPPAS